MSEYLVQDLCHNLTQCAHLLDSGMRIIWFALLILVYPRPVVCHSYSVRTSLYISMYIGLQGS